MDTRNLALLPTLLALAGCAHGPAAPERATVYFASPAAGRVRVFEFADLEQGTSVTDFGEIDGPVSVVVGKVSFTFQCPHTSPAANYTTRLVEVPKSGEYCLRCDEVGELSISPRY